MRADRLDALRADRLDALRADRLDALRADRLDALRAVAMLWMAGFHFCFDLNVQGLMQPRQNFYGDPFWTWQRIAIVSLFLLCAGLGQSFAIGSIDRAGFDRAFWRRWSQVAACALLVSLGSKLMFPHSWISFGVLHGIALMLIVLRLLSPLRAWLWPLALVALLLPQFVQHPLFDTRWTNWVGLVTHKPVTEDYVPLLPWLGVMLGGLAAGRWLARHAPALLQGPLPRPARWLAVLGRWPLTFYMLHQPLLIGSLLAGRSLGWW
jgi:uncharacterized membrane protein